MKRIGMMLVVVGFLVGACAGLAAAECAVCDMAASDSYPTKTGGQLVRGVANTGGCWMELANQPMKEMKEGGNILIGMGKGVGHTCIRLVQGVGEIVTCPMPRAKDGKFTQIAHNCPMDMWRS